MRKFSTWLLVCFMVMFWVFRIMVALEAQLNAEFIVEPLNETFEIALIFVTFVCLLLIIKRKLVGAIVYVVSYGLYFGVDIVNNVKALLDTEATATVSNYMSTFFSFVGMIIALSVLLDMLADKNRKAHPKDKKTDWYYKNEEYDRQLDERADKNNYRTL